jgi:hydrogenase maturation factor HypE
MNEKRDGEWSPVLHDEIIGIVERQIAENNPKETKETLNRLIKLGYDRDEAIEKIGSAVVGEIYNILKFHEKFNERRFVERLHSLK